MLHRINLLPWREQQRKAHKQRFLRSIVGCLMITAAIQWWAGFYIDSQKQRQHLRLTFLQAHMASLDIKIQKMEALEKEHQALLTRLKVVEGLQIQRNKTTELMNLLPTLIPEGVYIDTIKMSHQQINITGISDTTSRLATMLERFENSTWLDEVAMHSIVHDKPRFGEKFQSFSVSFDFLLTAEKMQEAQGG